jgi:hypothetical protein
MVGNSVQNQNLLELPPYNIQQFGHMVHVVYKTCFTSVGENLRELVSCQNVNRSLNFLPII